MWKLWKKTTFAPEEIEIRVRALEAEVKAQNLEIDKLYNYVRSSAGRIDKKKALMERANGVESTADLLSENQILSMARGRNG